VAVLLSLADVKLVGCVALELTCDVGSVELTEEVGEVIPEVIGVVVGISVEVAEGLVV
jgi:hypothetical protein